ncbi:MAG: DUF2332 domain-containing protein, partial [Planctomycetota bacterium]
DDAQLLDLADGVRPGQPLPNVLLSVVKYLLHGEQGAAMPDHRLHAIMAAADDIAASVPDDAFAAWRDFALANADEVRLQVAYRNVQTNEVGRSAVLACAYASIARREPDRPLAIVEVGSSAGLNLQWHRYRCEYWRTSPDRRDAAVGPADSPVVLSCELRGDGRPPHLANGDHAMPAPASSAGIDLVPVDVRDADQCRWLRALVWPGMPAREQRLLAALELARQAPPRVEAGNALTWMNRLDELVAPGAAVVVAHSFVLNQFTPLERETFAERLQAASASLGTTYQVAYEHVHGMVADLRLTTRRPDGDTRSEHLARAHPHGLWIEWL